MREPHPIARPQVDEAKVGRRPGRPHRDRQDAQRSGLVRQHEIQLEGAAGPGSETDAARAVEGEIDDAQRSRRLVTTGGEAYGDARAEAALATLTPEARSQARASALRILSRAGGGLNLSAWARSLSRTADRIGLLLAADVPAAFTGAKDMGELDKDIVEFAFSAAHVTLRRELGLARS